MGPEGGPLIAPAAGISLWTTSARPSSVELSSRPAIEDGGSTPPPSTGRGLPGRRRTALRERAPRSGGLLCPDGHEDDDVGSSECRKRHRHAIDPRLQPRLRRDREPLTLVERRGIREERGRVPVQADPEQRQPEGRAAQLAVYALAASSGARLSPDEVNRRRCLTGRRAATRARDARSSGGRFRDHSLVSEPEPGVLPVRLRGCPSAYASHGVVPPASTIPLPSGLRRPGTPPRARTRRAACRRRRARRSRPDHVGRGTEHAPPEIGVTGHGRSSTASPTSSTKHHAQSSPGSAERMSGWPLSRKWAVACRFGDSSQQPMLPQARHIRR